VTPKQTNYKIYSMPIKNLMSFMALLLKHQEISNNARVRVCVCVFIYVCVVYMEGKPMYVYVGVCPCMRVCLYACMYVSVRVYIFSFSPRRPGIAPRAAHVNKVAPGQVFLRVIRFSTAAPYSLMHLLGVG
jgi:hypothetical protein